MKNIIGKRNSAGWTGFLSVFFEWVTVVGQPSEVLSGLRDGLLFLRGKWFSGLRSGLRGLCELLLCLCGVLLVGCGSPEVYLADSVDTEQAVSVGGGETASGYDQLRENADGDESRENADGESRENADGDESRENADSDESRDAAARDGMLETADGEGTQESADRDGAQLQSGQEVCVYVCGAVKQPGVYMLAAGSRIGDAVDAAGGMKKSADASFWNLAERVSDGQMINVPTKEETAAGIQSAGNGSSGDRTSDETASGQSCGESRGDNIDAKDLAEVESGSAGGAMSGGGSGVDSDGRIDINCASREELQKLPGIGEARADKIIAYRMENGGFSKPEDIMNVSGIGEGLYAKLREYITV